MRSATPAVGSTPTSIERIERRERPAASAAVISSRLARVSPPISAGLPASPWSRSHSPSATPSRSTLAGASTPRPALPRTPSVPKSGSSSLLVAIAPASSVARVPSVLLVRGLVGGRGRRDPDGLDAGRLRSVPEDDVELGREVVTGLARDLHLGRAGGARRVFCDHDEVGVVLGEQQLAAVPDRGG